MVSIWLGENDPLFSENGSQNTVFLSNKEGFEECRMHHNVYPLTPHFIVKLGFIQGYSFFLIFALKHRLWVLVPTIYVLSKNKKNITIFHLKIIFLTPVKNCSILHGRVFVMQNTVCFLSNKECRLTTHYVTTHTVIFHG